MSIFVSHILPGILVVIVCLFYLLMVRGSNWKYLALIIVGFVLMSIAIPLKNADSLIGLAYFLAISGWVIGIVGCYMNYKFRKSSQHKKKKKKR